MAAYVDALTKRLQRIRINFFMGFVFRIAVIIEFNSNSISKGDAKEILTYAMSWSGGVYQRKEFSEAEHQLFGAHESVKPSDDLSRRTR